MTGRPGSRGNNAVSNSNPNALNCAQQVWPTEYGVQRKWYFPFTPSFWREQCECCLARKAALGTPLLAVKQEEEHKVELPPSEGGEGDSKSYVQVAKVEPLSESISNRPGLRIRRLRKVFESVKPAVTAVHGLDLDIAEGQVLRKRNNKQHVRDFAFR